MLQDSREALGATVRQAESWRRGKGCRSRQQFGLRLAIHDTWVHMPKGLDPCCCATNRYIDRHIGFWPRSEPKSGFGSDPGLDPGLNPGFATLGRQTTPHTTTHMLKHVTTPSVIFEPESMISHRRVSISYIRSFKLRNYKSLGKLSAMPLVCRFPVLPHFPCSYVVM